MVRSRLVFLEGEGGLFGWKIVSGRFGGRFLVRNCMGDAW